MGLVHSYRTALGLDDHSTTARGTLPLRVENDGRPYRVPRVDRRDAAVRDPLDDRAIEVGVGPERRRNGHPSLAAHEPPMRVHLSLIHISEPTRLGMISYAVFCL